MKLKFVPITYRTFDHEAALAFEAQYEPQLQLTLEEKRELSVIRHENRTFGFYLIKDDEIIGETHGVAPCVIGADYAIDDCAPQDDEGIYCYGTTIKPFHQGKGFGKLLKTYWMGFLAARGYKATYGHATSLAMVQLVRSLGAEFGAKHENWQGSGRDAVFYTIKL